MSVDLFDMFLMMDGGERASVREKYIRAPVNYMGSKLKSLTHLLPLLPYNKVWVDVFGGSGVVTLNRAKSPLEVFNDRWSGITSFYKCLQDPDKLDDLINRIELAPHSREFFIWCKETENDNDDVVRAFKSYYLIQSSFAGRGECFGRVVKGKNNIHMKIHENAKILYPIVERFKEVQIENLSWETCLKDFDSEDTVFYMDPPYFDSNIYKHKFTRQDHILMCNQIFKVKGFVALSGYDNDVYKMYPWSHIYSWNVKTDVATMATSEGASMEGKDTKRDSRKEYLWIKEASQ